MHIHTLRIRNFRRLTNARVDLESNISIFVGANNSGKTSASEAIQLFFAGSRDRFSIHDFNAESWPLFDAFGEQVENSTLPKISLDLWFQVGAPDLHRVIDLLPSLSWQGSLVGLRIEFVAQDEAMLLSNFQIARERARANRPAGQDDRAEYHPSPRTLSDYLTDNLRYEFELRYYVLDRARFDDSFVEATDYTPLQITPDKGRGGKDVLNSLVRVDFLSAQRHLSDSVGGSRSEDLSRCLSRFYDRSLEKIGDDFDAASALAQSEAMLNDHLARVFEPTLRQLSKLGYPGLSNPRLLIRSAINPSTIMSSRNGATVHYALGEHADGIEPPMLPDQYNGLGYRNLIYMVVELLSFHTQWMDIEEERPPLHLIFIEEPEAHLHAQLQQVFIRKVMDLLSIDGDDSSHYSSQIVVTTHSPHILYERGFRPIRYFRRTANTAVQSTEILNLSVFHDSAEPNLRVFLERYLKLTHCDLFFADAVVLVEGNVERLLLPQMLETSAPRLKSAYLTILEIGGAFGHRFRSLIEFLGIVALIITDIDSVVGGPEPSDGDEEEDEDGESTEGGDDDGQDFTTGTACMVNVADAVTSNQTLIQWLPAKARIDDLLAASEADRTQPRTNHSMGMIRVAYQTPVDVTWRGITATHAGRTLEEAFAFENLGWCQDRLRDDLKLRIPKNSKLTLEQLVERIHRRIKGSSFKKTDFALALLAQDPAAWSVPTYIAQGLQWLQDEITPIPEPPPTTPPDVMTEVLA